MKEILHATQTPNKLFPSLVHKTVLDDVHDNDFLSNSAWQQSLCCHVTPTYAPGWREEPCTPCGFVACNIFRGWRVSTQPDNLRLIRWPPYTSALQANALIIWKEGEREILQENMPFVFCLAGVTNAMSDKGDQRRYTNKTFLPAPECDDVLPFLFFGLNKNIISSYLFIYFGHLYLKNKQTKDEDDDDEEEEEEAAKNISLQGHHLRQCHTLWHLRRFIQFCLIWERNIFFIKLCFVMKFSSCLFVKLQSFQDWSKSNTHAHCLV
ncbi:uncharacterized protein LOC120308194 [Crotalus tigris]|uniref:uncharacterized protein LOC120308194 n=1 Tax=Crotalus tigris TaxID=88082 RepID=UPI00192F314F|nr:uncharacterized protein LOC120308194 [Crotalus tigris]XP_039199833.1 uncharacterized protein LOC120308194 [Crotalus tigris]